MEVQKAPPRRLGGYAGARKHDACDIAAEAFMTALRAKALTHGLTVGGYRLDCYFDGCQIWVIANRVWDNVGEDVAILLCEDFGTVLPTGWQFYIDFVIPKGFDTDGTPILEGVFSDTYEVASSA